MSRRKSAAALLLFSPQGNVLLLISVIVFSIASRNIQRQHILNGKCIKKLFFSLAISGKTSTMGRSVY
jgi:hypothetical protein